MRTQALSGPRVSAIPRKTGHNQPSNDLQNMQGLITMGSLGAPISSWDHQIKGVELMPFFSIYAPESGPLHYFTITLIGLQRGVILKWSHHPKGWSPQVIHLHQLSVYKGTRLQGYALTDPNEIDTMALEAMMGQNQSWP